MEQLSQLYDIYDMVYVPFYRTLLFKCIMGVAALVLLIYFGKKIYAWYLLRAKKKTPYQRSIEALDILDAQAVLDIHNAAEFYSTLSAVLKVYLAHVYTDQQLMSKTDKELARFLQETSLDQIHYKDIVIFLLHADESKFSMAKKVNESSSKELISIVRTFINFIESLNREGGNFFAK